MHFTLTFSSLLNILSLKITFDACDTYLTSRKIRSLERILKWINFTLAGMTSLVMLKLLSPQICKQLELLLALLTKNLQNYLEQKEIWPRLKYVKCALRLCCLQFSMNKKVRAWVVPSF